MWRAWRPFLVLVLIDTTLKELGSGAPSVGSNSNEIPVNAQEPLSNTERNGAQPDHLTQLLSSLESNLEGIQALASLLNRDNTTKSTSNRIAQDFNGGAGVEEEVESCRFKRTNAVGEPGLGGCAAECATLFPAIQGQGQCLCPRNTKADCESKNGCSWSVVAQVCNHQFEGLYNALFRKLDKRGDTSEFTEEPYEFAYSIAISPVAAGGISTTGEIGVAFGSTGEIVGFVGGCLGIKADVSVELDIALGFWNSIDDVIGPLYQVGAGADTTAVGSDETGAHVEQIFNPDGGYIGFAVSLGYGYGVDLPIDYEVNFDKCRNVELWRFHWKDLYNMILESEPRPSEPQPSTTRLINNLLKFI